MSEWHEEFRAYARAFGKDEVAAILLRNAEHEWILWPDQVTEGLTFTLTADSMLDQVPPEHLQHIVGWVHSHPSGLDPHPSSTDDSQIRELAIDMAGGVAEMWIFGGQDYRLISMTKAVLLGDYVFVTDTETYRPIRVSTPWDHVASEFYKKSKPKPKVWAGPQSYGFSFPPANIVETDYLDTRLHWCPYCKHETSPSPGMLCDECNVEIEEETVAGWEEVRGHYS